MYSCNYLILNINVLLYNLSLVQQLSQYLVISGTFSLEHKIIYKIKLN